MKNTKKTSTGLHIKQKGKRIEVYTPSEQQKLRDKREFETDIVVGFKGKNLLLEIKDGDKKVLTPDQVNWHKLWKGQVHVVTSVDEAKLLLWKLTDDYRSE